MIKSFNDWISVKNMLPTPGELVLVRVKNKNKQDGIYLYDVCYINEETNTWSRRLHTWEYITDWKIIK